MGKFNFVVPDKSKINEKDPESIFRELQPPTIKGLWSQQADIIRDYYKNFRDKSDVALELPTGTGKTLLGLLIAEYRRRKMQRVVYLCPTKQLAYQVFEKSKEYRIPTVLLIGPQNNYNEKDYGSYLEGSAIAITTYSAIFNTNPKLNDAKTIIFDDAHSAENYISSLWTLKISRFESRIEFMDIMDIFKDDISDYQYARVIEEMYDSGRSVYDIIPYPKYIQKIDRLKNHIEEKISTGRFENAKYQWSKIKNNLYACNFFFNSYEINIRPLIPPTLQHSAFSNAEQRIYMSATLGDGGELERVLGIKKIAKIPVPTGWDKYSNGRRLILFPNRNFSQENALELVSKVINNQKKALILCPDKLRADYLKKEIVKFDPFLPILEADSIEENLDQFNEMEKAVLLLKSRYDGIDLSDDMCRLLIIYGLPSATNLQEGFMLERLGANLLVDELIKTRITQALGRCTRSNNDYTNVLMLGDDLLSFCSKNENLSSFHAEIQAEIEFGLQNSKEFESINDAEDMMRDFINDGEYFDAINNAINSIKENYEKHDKKGVDKLTHSVENEIEYLYAFWDKKLLEALEKSRQVVDSISGGREINGYRAWWHYLAGNTAFLAANQGVLDNYNLSKQNYSLATKNVSGLSWIAELIHALSLSSEESESPDILLIYQAEKIIQYLNILGYTGQKFEKSMDNFIQNISNDSAKKFEKGIEVLGKCLGFDTLSFSGDGKPDGVWKMENIVIGFEAKSEEKAEGIISLDTCRQANSHVNTIKYDYQLQFIDIIPITILSHKRKIHEVALPQCNELYHYNISNIRELATHVSRMLRSLRSLGNSNIDVNVVINMLKEKHLTYREIISLFTEVKANELEVSK